MNAATTASESSILWERQKLQILLENAEKERQHDLSMKKIGQRQSRQVQLDLGWSPYSHNLLCTLTLIE